MPESSEKEMDTRESQPLRKLWVRRFWIVLALATCWMQFREFSLIFHPLTVFAPDFYQDWASARNRLEGFPVYTHHTISIDRYREALYVKPGIPVRHDKDLEYNSWPPTAVLLALPLARLDFVDAFAIWTVVSLLAFAIGIGIVLRQCPVTLTPWTILPVVALLMLSHSFFFSVVMGQLNFILLFLLTGAWAADRSQRPWLAGALVGAATTLKLIPAFLFLYFLMRKQWRALLSGTVAILALTMLTVTLLGWECYRDYNSIVLPELTTVKWRVHYGNVSLASFWFKLLDVKVSNDNVFVHQNTVLSKTATVLSDAIVTILTGWSIWRSRSLRERDLGFSLAICAMLLVSPTIWDHTLILAFLPLFLLWYWTPPNRWTRVGFWGVLILLWVPRKWLWSIYDFKHHFTGQLTLKYQQAIVLWLGFTVTLLAMCVFTILVQRDGPYEVKENS